ncbi:helix-turn-helix domain-containing protein [Kitasatospora sp. NBC_00240]|uniref:helix-turn-helix transcriptional regulator n=1 Tax=Kitasatospora sp. NBC_00240 TaxID=2903567 RepID=UPI0022565043|nr:helix-turn-helix domain-containing protein [Kitasatospora sp. NBC_00240]MCX5213000.1 helix-turn-helix domain-containing protein [Kitasatospora sp. NBC_00240]
MRTVRNSHPDEWLTPREAAELTRLSVGTLANLRWRGTGPEFRKLGDGRSSAVRYRRSIVEKWIDSQTIAA